MGKTERSKKEPGIRNGDGTGPSSGRAQSAVVGDPRFSRMHSDPRFQRVPKNKAKVSIDSRFAGMFTDKGFNNSWRDKRGAKLKNKKEGRLLHRYYKVDDDDDEEAINRNAQEDGLGARRKREKEKKKPVFKENASTYEYSPGTFGTLDSGASDLDVEDEFSAPIAGTFEALDSGASVVDAEDEPSAPIEDEEEEEEEDSESSSSSDSESDVEEEVSSDENKAEVPTTTVETRRLAMMNMDWEHIRAVHLLVLMRSFLPKGGHVNSVSIYPSDFGVEQMREENEHGPKSIFGSDDEDGEEGEDPEKLRAYEIAKLRYYYAVVDCDSASTAAHLYNNCDGLEFERTSNTLDLRYIPDGMEFKHEPRDATTVVPDDFKPVEFETRALQHSNVKLTWDDDEPVRAKTLRRNFNRDELNEMDFQAYVASSSESEPDDGVNAAVVNREAEPKTEDGKGKVRSKYLALLGATEDPDQVRGNKSEKGNIEIKFNTGLGELSEKLLMKSKKNKADETVWQAYLRKKKEKKNARRRKAGVDSDVSDEDSDVVADHTDDPFFSHGDEDPFNDPFFNQEDESGDHSKSKGKDGNKGKEGKMRGPKESDKEEERKKRKDDVAKEKKEVERNQAELELLLLDDHMVQNGGGKTQKVQRLDKLSRKKSKKNKRSNEELMEKAPQTAAYEDPRFASLFLSHHFAIDPTDPHFQKTGPHMETIVKVQQQKLRLSKNADKLDTSGNQDGDQGRDGKRKAELSSLVSSLKSKVQRRRGKAIGS